MEDTVPLAASSRLITMSSIKQPSLAEMKWWRKVVAEGVADPLVGDPLVADPLVRGGLDLRHHPPLPSQVPLRFLRPPPGHYNQLVQRMVDPTIILVLHDQLMEELANLNLIVLVFRGAVT
mmetsp:Transcript_14073/g.30604  ORF Transcript_14073/g.30604 Transcript_14073/m.30604 type:complete len:121 (+) Transcript_14073:250-612(+)